jgi:outer membrane protein assembly factor BamB
MATMIALVLMMAILPITALQAQAQTQYTNRQEGGSTPGPLPAGVTADYSVETRAFLSFRPTVVGVGQTFLVNMWLNPATHASRYFKDYKVTITKADGTKEVITMPSYRADTTAWFEYIADQIGTWKLKFEFPGGYFPAGNYTPAPGAVMGTQTQNFQQSCYYKPSSTEEQTLIVQEQVVYPWPESPLPTDYWTRPASLENREWWPILGNYPGTGYSSAGGAMWDKLYPGTNPQWSSSYAFHPWVIGPNTAHVAWKRQGSIAGLVGGPAGQFGSTSSPGNPSIVYAGRCYQTYTKPGVGSTSQSYWQCYDIRTGQLYWEYPIASTNYVPNTIAYVTGGMLEVPGAEAGRTYSAELIRIQSGYLQKWNPWTGVLTTNVSISPLTGTFHNQMEGYVLGVVSGRLINWTTKGTTTNVTARIVSNTTYTGSLPSLIDWQSGYGAAVSVQTPAAMGAWYGTNIRGYNLYTGQMLWNITVDDTVYSPICAIADHGKVAVLMMGGYYMAWDLPTGNLAWKGDSMDYPWSKAAFGAYSIQSAYGMVFRQGYDGVYAFNWTNGKRVWKYEAQAYSPYESPYIDENGTTVYSFNTGATIADGKMFTYNTEHTESWPLTRGWGLHAINITTGELVWKIENPMSPGGVADGYLTAADSRDGYMYVFGKGKSATTVTAPDVAVPKGTGVVIKGSVLDQSPAQPGTPCVSKESMSLQMENLHLQMPVGGVWKNETITGVPVALTAIGSDGSVTDIGTVTTNGYYGTFNKEWTPPAEGSYEIIASFAGDESYGSSAASTAVSVGPAPAEITIPEQVMPPDYTMTILGGVIAVIIAVAVVGILLYTKK